MTIIAPSLLSCDFTRINHECQWLSKSKSQWLHLDVMDGVFVPNISFGIPIIKAIRQATNLFLDTHLMIVNPHKYIDAFHQAGANALSIHIEASQNPIQDLQHITQLGMKAGIAFNPETPCKEIFDVLAYVDFVCLMSVHPGFGGQKFIEDSVDKIKTLKQFIQKNKLNTLIEVDGGVTISNAKTIKTAGADILVAGSTIFKSKNPIQTIEDLLMC